MRNAASLFPQSKSHLAMPYVQVANRAVKEQTGGRHRDWAQRVSRSASRRHLPSALVPLVTLHAKSDDSEELWPSSKIGKRMCGSASFVHQFDRSTTDALGPI